MIKWSGKSERFNFWRAVVLSSLSTFIMLVGTVFQNCSPAELGTIDVASSNSPFAADRTVFNDAAFVDADTEEAGSQKTLAEAQSQKVLPKGLKLSIMLNNQCAQDMCAQDSRALSCYLHQNFLNPDRISGFQFYSLELEEDMTEPELDQWIKEKPSDEKCIVGVSQEMTYKSSFTNETFYNEQSPDMEATRFTTGNSLNADLDVDTVVIGVIDTGVEDHPDMKNAILKKDMRTAANKADTTDCPSGNWDDYWGHGTAVASVITARRDTGSGIIGYGVNADVNSYMVGRCKDAQASTTELANAILEAVEDKVDVINLSYGGNTGDDVSMLQAMLIATNENVVVVVSAGNSAQDINKVGVEYYPAVYSTRYPGVIAVAASDSNGNLASFSNFTATNNASNKAPRVAAPGVDLHVAASQHCKFCDPVQNDGATRFARVDGTSFSAPYFAAAVGYAIGYLKKNDVFYTAQYVDELTTKIGVRYRPGLNGVVGRNILDYIELDKGLRGITNGDLQLSSMNAWAYNSEQNGKPRIRVFTNWNLNTVRPGMRLGVFDGTCGATSPSCLIESVPVPESSNHTFYLDRNELIPLIPGPRDKSMALNIMVAIHYPIPSDFDEDGKPTKFKNNHGIEVSKTLNLRDMDFSDSNSELIGEITNIRMDMQYFYVKGWACYQKSNKMVEVELQDLAGTPIPARYRYHYPFMVPHSTPIDKISEFSVFKNLGTRPYVEPFMAIGIEAMFNTLNETKYGAGIETIPQAVLNCKTVTAAHGFEFLVPIHEIAQNNLEETAFQVVGTYQKGGNTIRENIKGPSGRFSFEFPEVNFQPNVSQDIAIDRSASDRLQIDGRLCSNSASPIEVEVSAHYAGFLAAVYGNNKPQKGADGGRQDLILGNELYHLGYVYDPNAALQPYQKQNLRVELELPGMAKFEEFDSVGEYLDTIEANDLIVTVTKFPGETFEVRDGMGVDALAKITHYQDAFDFFDVDGTPDGLGSNVMNTDARIGNIRWFDTSGKWSRAAGSMFYDYDMATMQRLRDAEFKIKAAIETAIKAQDFRQVQTGQPVDFYYPVPKIFVDLGQAHYDQKEDNLVDRAIASFRPPSDHWDYYDVGEPFSTDLVGYALDQESDIGKYIKGTYGVEALLREAKKFEVPQSYKGVNMGHQQLAFQGRGNCSAGQFSHRLDYDIVNYEDYAPVVSASESGFWVEGFDPNPDFQPDSPKAIMKRIPVELRFFQDGRLLLHLESNRGNIWTPVEYPFHNPDDKSLPLLGGNQ